MWHPHCYANVPPDVQISRKISRIDSYPRFWTGLGNSFPKSIPNFGITGCLKSISQIYQVFRGGTGYSVPHDWNGFGKGRLICLTLTNIFFTGNVLYFRSNALEVALTGHPGPPIAHALWQTSSGSVHGEWIASQPQWGCPTHPPRPDLAYHPILALTLNHLFYISSWPMAATPGRFTLLLLT